ncbi:helix-turn-helix domain-containing protein [Variovorax dokdonensis]|uniref:helix-turn-helix domain-containing protein n=1 Tax=Variovorax dokdonensis TaxID=344883 RepID=UPI0034A3CA20
MHTISASEVATLLDCTKETVLDKAAAGQLAAIKYGRSWVFLRDALFEGLHQVALSNLKPRSFRRPNEERPRLLAYAEAVPSRTTTRRTTRPILPAM